MPLSSTFQNVLDLKDTAIPGRSNLEHPFTAPLTAPFTTAHLAYPSVPLQRLKLRAFFNPSWQAVPKIRSGKG